MKKIKIFGIMCFALSSLNLLGNTKINEKRACLVTTLGINNCGNLHMVRTSAWTYGNASQESLCAAARERGLEELNKQPCESTKTPPILFT